MFDSIEIVRDRIPTTDGRRVEIVQEGLTRFWVREIRTDRVIEHHFPEIRRYHDIRNEAFAIAREPRS